MFSRTPIHSLVRSTSFTLRGMSSYPSRMNGKVAIVTASTDGIGYAIARRLAQEGAKVMISSRKEENVTKAVQQLRDESLTVEGCVCHVGKPEDRSAVIQKTLTDFGRLDVLVSNAAVNPHMGDILDSTDKHWDKLLDINVKSAYMLCKEAVPHLQQDGGGNIVFVSSVIGYVPLEALGPYSVCKTALIGMVKALVPSCSKKSIRVNGIAPGIIKTSFSKALWATEKAEKSTSKMVPLNRLGTPEDCANLAAFLASEEASYITGETVVVAGGMTSRL